MIECILSDSLFAGTFIAGVLVGSALGVAIMCIISMNKYEDPHKDTIKSLPTDVRFLYSRDGERLITCEEEDLNDPIFMDKAHRLLNGGES